MRGAWIVIALSWTITAAAQEAPAESTEPAANAPAPEAAARASNEEEARTRFNLGREAYDAGRFESALRDFQTAYELSGRAGLLYNIGLAQDRLRQDADALATYERYLELTPDSPYRAQVEGRITALREAINQREAERQAAIDEARRREQEAAAAAAAAAREPETPLVRQWWLWTIIGVVVAGAAVGAGIGIKRANEPDYAQGDFGGVTFTLGSR